jgi:hypothetical protein
VYQHEILLELYHARLERKKEKIEEAAIGSKQYSAERPAYWLRSERGVLLWVLRAGKRDRGFGAGYRTAGLGQRAARRQ